MLTRVCIAWSIESWMIDPKTSSFILPTDKWQTHLEELNLLAKSLEIDIIHTLLIPPGKEQENLASVIKAFEKHLFHYRYGKEKCEIFPGGPMLNIDCLQKAPGLPYNCVFSVKKSRAYKETLIGHEHLYRLDDYSQIIFISSDKDALRQARELGCKTISLSTTNPATIFMALTECLKETHSPDTRIESAYVAQPSKSEPASIFAPNIGEDWVIVSP